MAAKRNEKKRDEAPDPSVTSAPDVMIGSRPEVVVRAARQHTSHVRRAMLDTAAELFAERGFAGTNLKDLADALGMSRPGLYYHFPSKEKLLEALIEEVTLSAERYLAGLSAGLDRDPEDALRGIVHGATLWVLDNHVLFRVLDRSDAEMPAEMRTSHDSSKKAILELFTDVIRRGIDAGVFSPVDPHVAALSLAGMRNWTAWWYQPGGRLSREQIADTIAEMSVRAVVRPDGARAPARRVSDGLRNLKEDVEALSRLIEQ